MRHTIRSRLAMLATAAFVSLAGLISPAAADEKKDLESVIIGKANDFVFGTLPGMIAEPIVKGLWSDILSSRKRHTATATIKGTNQFHVAVGDVYAFDVDLQFVRQSRPTGKTFEPVLWQYGYDVLVDGVVAVSKTLTIRQPDFDGSYLFYSGETYAITDSVYLMATSLMNDNCGAVGTAQVTIQPWVKEDAKRLALKTEANGVLRTVRSDGEWRLDGETSKAKTVDVHNPWTVALTSFPTEIQHLGPATSGNISYTLTERRPFPGANPGSGPQIGRFITRITQNSAEHISVAQRQPGQGNIGLGNGLSATFSHAYTVTPGTGHHFPNGGDQAITFSFDAKLSGTRQLRPGVGPQIAWDVQPQIVTANTVGCDAFVWDVVDHDAKQDACDTLEVPLGLKPVEGGHLPGRSYSFAFGEEADGDYFAGDLTVTPGITCYEDGGLSYVGFPLFAGASREGEFFDLNVTGGTPWTNIYFEQWLRLVRFEFDTGAVAESYDHAFAVAIPEGASRVTRLEMVMKGSSEDVTLVWQ